MLVSVVAHVLFGDAWVTATTPSLILLLMLVTLSQAESCEPVLPPNALYPVSAIIFFPVNVAINAQVSGSVGLMLDEPAAVLADVPDFGSPPLVWRKLILVLVEKNPHQVRMAACVNHGEMSHEINAFGNWLLIAVAISSKKSAHESTTQSTILLTCLAIVLPEVWFNEPDDLFSATKNDSSVSSEFFVFGNDFSASCTDEVSASGAQIVRWAHITVLKAPCGSSPEGNNVTIVHWCFVVFQSRFDCFAVPPNIEVISEVGWFVTNPNTNVIYVRIVGVLVFKPCAKAEFAIWERTLS